MRQAAPLDIELGRRESPFFEQAVSAANLADPIVNIAQTVSPRPNPADMWEGLLQRNCVVGSETFNTKWNFMTSTYGNNISTTSGLLCSQVALTQALAGNAAIFIVQPVASPQQNTSGNSARMQTARATAVNEDPNWKEF